jgi:WD40 repeat protein
MAYPSLEVEDVRLTPSVHIGEDVGMFPAFLLLVALGQQAALPRPVHVLQHKGDLVLRVRYSPDGKLLLAATSAQETIVWDTTNRRVVAVAVTPNRNGIAFGTGASFSRDGKWLATAQRDTAAEIRDTQTWRVLHPFPCEDYHSVAIAFRPNQNQLAVGDGSVNDAAAVNGRGVVKVWDIGTESLIAVLHGHRGWINAVTYSPDGKLLATASCDQTAVIWNAETLKPVRTLQGHQDSVKEVVFSPSGHRLATVGGDGKLIVSDVASGKECCSTMAHKGGVWDAQFSPDGKLIATAGWSDVPRGELEEVSHGNKVRVNWKPSGVVRGEMKLWDSSTAERRASRVDETNDVYSVAFSPDGTRLATGHSGGAVKIWDVAKLLEQRGTK